MRKRTVSNKAKKNKEKNKLLIAEIKRQQSINDWTYEDLEKETGIPKSTISAFMCGVRDGDEVREALSAFAEALVKRRTG